MTLISSLIRDAYRESNLIATSADPTTDELAEGVSVLNQFVGSLFGHEAGEELVDVSVSSASTTLRPNERALVAYNTGDVTLTLPPTPDNGARVQIIDTVIGGSRTITLAGNGRKIVGAASVVSAAGANKLYMYRADLGEWLLISPLTSSDTLPFPADYETLFIAAIAVRINPRNGQPVPEGLVKVYERDITRIQFDYRQTGQYDEPRTRSLLNRALRIAELVPVTGQPRAAQLTDALRRLNASISSLFGEELGERLDDIDIVDNAYFRSTTEVPSNIRIVANLTEAVTVTLPKTPVNGARFAVADILENFNDFPLTVDGNGRKIEGSTTMVLNVAGLQREWFYRSDLNAWVPLVVLSIGDEPPFPEEYDQLLEIMTAVRLSPKALSDQLVAASRRMLGQFKSRYRQSVQMPSELALLRLNADTRYMYSDLTDFELGLYGRFSRRY